jgi:predicted metal-dependent hydrolase
MNSIQYGHRQLFYEIIKSNGKKTISIRVDSTGVSVRAPRRISERDILAFVEKKARWILGKQEQIKQAMQLHPPKEFVSGESFPYLGKQYRLKIIRAANGNRAACRLVNGRLQVEIDPDLDRQEGKMLIKQALIDWYLAHAEDKTKERISRFAGQLGVRPKSIEIKNQKSRWGSCSYAGILRFNWKIIMAPVSVLDYIIVHELCHLKHPNHSAAFWNEVQSLIPDYRDKKVWLKEHQMIIHVFDNTITTS